jgi:Leucine-rich repeat (LRR) protein
VPKKTFPPRLFALHTVDVSNNLLDNVDTGVFSGLAALRKLDMSRNSLTAIRATTFGTIHTLLELDLSWNRISKMARYVSPLVTHI